MGVFEYVLYVVFTVGVFLIAIGIFFYNSRHEDSIKVKKINKLEHEKKKDKIIEFKQSERFDWEIYEDDLTIDDKRFLGFDIWEFQETALERIAQLKKDFEHNDSLYFNLIEILMLIDKHGEFIKISDDGEFIIKKLYLSNFITKLSYDIEIINSLHEIKREYLSVSNEIEIDAREIFFIMKNAKNFGLGNVENHVQFFQFINKNKSEIIIDDMSVNLNTSNNIKIIVSDEVSEEIKQTADGMIVKKSLTAKEELQNVINSYLTEIGKETLENGNTKLTYLDGTVVIKNGPWEIVEVKTLEDIKKEEDEMKDKKSKENQKRIGEVANHVMSSVTEEMEDKKVILEKDFTDDKSNVDLNTSEMNIIPKAFENESEFLIPLKNKNVYFIEKGKEKSYYGFFESVSNDKDFDSAFRTLDRNNMLTLLGMFFNEDFFNVTYIDDNNSRKSVSLFLTDGRNYYLSYEFVIYVLFNLVKNKDALLQRTLVSINGFSMRYPSVFIETLITHYKNLFGSDLFVYLDGKNFFYKSFLLNGNYFRTNFLIIDSKVIQHISVSQKEIINKAKMIKLLNKEDMAALTEKKIVPEQISLKTFKIKGTNE